MKKYILSFFVLLFAMPAFACTSVIISGKMSASGRPVMYKHRDTRKLDNFIGRYTGEKYTFIGLVNSETEGCEVWMGTNNVGFSIMNTATYDLKDDDVPASQMDREGNLMYLALGKCESIKDFETLLDTLSRPMGVEANFGVIDAHGGAAYYEVNNHKWVKFDVNDNEVAPLGYIVVTNFTQTGRPQDRKGVDRYDKGYEIMKSVVPGKKDLFCDHAFLLNRFSREGKPILRSITSSAIAIEGVADGGDPTKSVMWTICGYPTATPCIPLMVLDVDFIPYYLRAGDDNHSVICDIAMNFKSQDKDLSKVCRDLEKFIDKGFSKIYNDWVSQKITDSQFKVSYNSLLSKLFEKYEEKLAKIY